MDTIVAFFVIVIVVVVVIIVSGVGVGVKVKFVNFYSAFDIHLHGQDIGYRGR